MTKPKVIRNHYCTDPEDRVIPYSCQVCVKCWLFVAGRKTGYCPFGGPFGGYERVDEQEGLNARTR